MVNVSQGGLEFKARTFLSGEQSSIHGSGAESTEGYKSKGS